MRIMQVITLSSVGGAQRVVSTLANSMCEENEVMVISNSGGVLWGQLDDRVIRFEIPSLCRSISPLSDLRTIFALRKLYKQFKPDIIHLHSSKAGILGRIAFPKEKIVYTVHGFDSIRIAYRHFLPIEKIMKSRAKAIVGVSRYDYLNLKAEGISKNTYIVYNGVDKIGYDSSLKLPFHNTKKNILAISRANPPKNFKLFREIAIKLPQYNFIWIGGMMQNITLPPNLICMGEIVDASKYFTLCDLSILTSNYEGLPMSIIEAMSVGKPIVASNVGGISEIVIDGVTGYAVENSADLFVEKILAILSNDKLYDEMVHNTVKLVGDKLTADIMVQGYLDIYNR